jgi:hypothetical protein
MKKEYCFFYLEMALKKADDLHIYAFENVSHIPTAKLIEIFRINLKKDPFIVDGYLLTKTQYKKHKKYLNTNIGSMNLDVFEYCLMQYACDDYKQIRKLYKENLME